MVQIALDQGAAIQGGASVSWPHGAAYMAAYPQTFFMEHMQESRLISTYPASFAALWKCFAKMTVAEVDNAVQFLHCWGKEVLASWIGKQPIPVRPTRYFIASQYHRACGRIPQTSFVFSLYTHSGARGEMRKHFKLAHA